MAKQEPDSYWIPFSIRIRPTPSMIRFQNFCVWFWCLLILFFSSNWNIARTMFDVTKTVYTENARGKTPIASSYEEIARILSDTSLVRISQGVCIIFTTIFFSMSVPMSLYWAAISSKINFGSFMAHFFFWLVYGGPVIFDAIIIVSGLVVSLLVVWRLRANYWSLKVTTRLSTSIYSNKSKSSESTAQKSPDSTKPTKNKGKAPETKPVVPRPYSSIKPPGAAYVIVKPKDPIPTEDRSNSNSRRRAVDKEVELGMIIQELKYQLEQETKRVNGSRAEWVLEKEGLHKDIKLEKAHSVTLQRRCKRLEIDLSERNLSIANLTREVEEKRNEAIRDAKGKYNRLLDKYNKEKETHQSLRNSIDPIHLQNIELNAKIKDMEASHQGTLNTYRHRVVAAESRLGKVSRIADRWQYQSRVHKEHRRVLAEKLKLAEWETRRHKIAEKRLRKREEAVRRAMKAKVRSNASATQSPVIVEELLPLVIPLPPSPPLEPLLVPTTPILEEGKLLPLQLSVPAEEPVLTTQAQDEPFLLPEAVVPIEVLSEAAQTLLLAEIIPLPFSPPLSPEVGPSQAEISSPQSHGQKRRREDDPGLNIPGQDLPQRIPQPDFLQEQSNNEEHPKSAQVLDWERSQVGVNPSNPQEFNRQHGPFRTMLDNAIEEIIQEGVSQTWAPSPATHGNLFGQSIDEVLQGSSFQAGDNNATAYGFNATSSGILGGQFAINDGHEFQQSTLPTQMALVESNPESQNQYTVPSLMEITEYGTDNIVIGHPAPQASLEQDVSMSDAAPETQRPGQNLPQPERNMSLLYAALKQEPDNAWAQDDLIRNSNPAVQPVMQPPTMQPAIQPAMNFAMQSAMQSAMQPAMQPAMVDLINRSMDPGFNTVSQNPFAPAVGFGNVQQGIDQDTDMTDDFAEEERLVREIAEFTRQNPPVFPSGYQGDLSAPGAAFSHGNNAAYQSTFGSVFQNNTSSTAQSVHYRDPTAHSAAPQNPFAVSTSAVRSHSRKYPFAVSKAANPFERKINWETLKSRFDWGTLEHRTGDLKAKKNPFMPPERMPFPPRPPTVEYTSAMENRTAVVNPFRRNPFAVNTAESLVERNIDWSRAKSKFDWGSLEHMTGNLKPGKESSNRKPRKKRSNRRRGKKPSSTS
ncbi:hypothetical protein BGZ63DRAFT_426673 [Mariannaea sp. PMI_226]|nr:hypothetical protein BGZ63DRAFT_426673 [Mariannaea sp. PMI_226]